MILTFDDVLDEAEHAALLEIARAAAFVDGRETAGPRLATTKRNEQVARADPGMHAVAEKLLGALKRHDAFRASAYPRQLHGVILARYRPGMEYGSHVDEALMGDAHVYRSDLSVTVFLNAREDYDGGELALESGSGEIRIKLAARALVCYPTGQLHRVLPVTRGERLVVVGWLQSYVRDAAARETLWDLFQAREAIYAREGKSRAFDLVNKTHTNLLRRWAQT
jgi:PKHD-type hydroxylase